MAVKDHVGFIGLGAMGARMAANVLDAGYTLTVYNRDREKTRDLAARGAAVAESPRDLAARSDVALLMLSDPAAVCAVMLGDEGVLAGARDGLALVDMSTVGPADALAVVEAARARGVQAVNAPVLGTLGPAAKGELLILAGGAEDTVERVRPVLETMGKTVRYLGSNERACAAKLAANLLLAGSLQLFGEAVALTTRWGLPREQALELLGGTAVVSPALKGKMPAMYDPGAAVDFSLRLARKDLWLALGAAYEKGAAMPLAATALETFTLAMGAHGDEDASRIAAYIDDAGVGS